MLRMLPKGCKNNCSTYVGFKVMICEPLQGPSIYHVPTWTLWAEQTYVASCRKAEILAHLGFADGPDTHTFGVQRIVLRLRVCTFRCRVDHLRTRRGFGQGYNFMPTGDGTFHISHEFSISADRFHQMFLHVRYGSLGACRVRFGTGELVWMGYMLHSGHGTQASFERKSHFCTVVQSVCTQQQPPDSTLC